MGEAECNPAAILTFREYLPQLILSLHQESVTHTHMVSSLKHSFTFSFSGWLLVIMSYKPKPSQFHRPWSQTH